MYSATTLLLLNLPFQKMEKMLLLFLTRKRILCKKDPIQAVRMMEGPQDPRVPRELVEVLTKLLSIIYQQSWLTREVPADWRLANVMPIYKKGWKGDLGKHRPVSLTSVPGKVTDQIILSATIWQV